MAAQPVMNAEELAEGLRHASPSTSDDVTILPDGWRTDSRESAMAWLTELAAARAVAMQRTCNKGGAFGHFVSIREHSADEALIDIHAGQRLRIAVQEESWRGDSNP